MNQPPPWLFNVDVAKQECRVTLDKLSDQVGRLRQLVEDSDSYAPDALRVSFEQAVPDLKQAGQAAIARMQILVHLRAVQRVDATPSKQLIALCFPQEKRSAVFLFIRPI